MLLRAARAVGTPPVVYPIRAGVPALRPIQRVVGRPNQRAGRQARPCRGRPDRCAQPHRHALAPQERIAGDAPLKPRRHCCGTSQPGGRQQDGELVTPHARCQIGPPRGGAQARRRLDEHAVAERMSVSIVHCLEPIEIDTPDVRPRSPSSRRRQARDGDGAGSAGRSDRPSTTAPPPVQGAVQYRGRLFQERPEPQPHTERLVSREATESLRRTSPARAGNRKGRGALRWQARRTV